MLIGLELLVQNADAVPKLGVLDVFKRVEGVLVRVEGLMNIVSQQVAVTERCPGRSVLGVQDRHLLVEVDRLLVVPLRRAELGEFAQLIKVVEHVFLVKGLLLGRLELLHALWLVAFRGIELLQEALIVHLLLALKGGLLTNEASVFLHVLLLSVEARHSLLHLLDVLSVVLEDVWELLHLLQLLHLQLVLLHHRHRLLVHGVSFAARLAEVLHQVRLMNVGWAERLRVVLQSSLRVLGWLLPVGERLLLLLLAWLGLELLGKLRGEILHIRLLLHEVADLHVAWVERLLAYTSVNCDLVVNAFTTALVVMPES